MAIGRTPGADGPSRNGVDLSTRSPNGANGVGHQPLSVEDLLAKQKAEKEAASKPKFMTKAERAALAVERRQAEIAAQQDRLRAEREERERFERQAEEERRKAQMEAQRGRYGAGPAGGVSAGYGGRYGAYQQQIANLSPPIGNSRAPPSAPRGPGGPRSGPQPPSGPRGGASQTFSHTPSPLANSSTASSSSKANRNGSVNTDGIAESAVPPTEAELEVIRARYLGVAPAAGIAPKKPRLRKLADKKFVFDWDESDDTSSGEAGNWRDSLVAAVPGQTGSGMSPTNRLAGYAAAPKRGDLPKSDTHADAFERRRAERGLADERHWSEKPLKDMKDRDWRIFREDFNIAARGGQIPHPMRSWEESNIPSTILRIIEQIGYKEPSPIQRQAIPIGLQYRDLIGIAQTGSGKTAAFVIPMLEYISHLPPFDENNKHLGPYALILAPTRELAQQIETETKRFSTPLGYKTVSIVGGRSVEEQQFNLRDGAQIIIATPGRLKDMIDRNMIVLSQCRYVVMDEADRMVDLGFELDLTFILNAMPADFEKPEYLDVDPQAWREYRVTTLFSATMPPVVERLAKKYLRKPATVVIGVAGEAVDTVEQRVEFVQGPEKRKTRLIEILRTIGLPPPMIVFTNEKQTADTVIGYVRQAGKRAVTLHSGKNQEQREAALQSLRDGEVEVLVATDLAGRGIDVPDVTCVINWQMSSTIEKYVHRIGRTGRAGKQGVAITFLGSEDEEVMYDLKNEIAKSPVSKMNSELAHHPAARQRMTREMKRKRDDDD